MNKTLLCLITIAASAAMAAAPDKDGFAPFFDGKSLEGWVNVNCAPETWTIKEGMLHCDGIPTGALRTVKQYENFVLELEWRHLKPGGNAGVFIWSGPVSAKGQPFLRSVEVQVLDHGHGESASYTTHGDVFPIHGSKMIPLSPSRGDRSFPKEKHSKPSPEWNHYRIVCQDGSLRLSVNGHEVSGGDKCNWRKGYIALESEGGEVDWRNLRIKEMPSTNATAEESAPAAQGAISLYDGRSLRGWKEAAGWTPSDWVLKAKEAAPLECAKRLPDNCLLQFDLQWPGAPDAKLPLRIAGAEFPFAPPQKEKTWHRVELTRKDGKFTCRINDAPVEGEFACPGKTFSLLPQGTVSLASIYVTDLGK